MLPYDKYNRGWWSVFPTFNNDSSIMMMIMLVTVAPLRYTRGVQYLLRWQLLEADDTQKPLLVITLQRPTSFIACYIILGRKFE